MRMGDTKKTLCGNTLTDIDILVKQKLILLSKIAPFVEFWILPVLFL